MQARRNEKILGGGGVQIIKYCRPPLLTEEENFSHQIV